MTLHYLSQMMRQEALMALNSKTFMALGTITGYDPGSYTATVLLYPEDETTGSPALQTGWLPIFTPWAGNGWGLFLPPNIGDVVEVQFQEGSLQSGIICLRSYTNISPPLSVPSGEFWLVHSTGSSIKVTNDGKLSITGNVEIDVTAPVVNINSPAVKLGNLNDALTGLMNDVAITVFNEHTHPQEGGGTTSAPTQQLSSTALTTNVQGN